MPFRHDAGVFRPNGVSRRNFGGLKTPNPSSFGHRVCLGKKVEAKNPNGVSAKCAIGTYSYVLCCVLALAHLVLGPLGLGPARRDLRAQDLQARAAKDFKPVASADIAIVDSCPPGGLSPKESTPTPTFRLAAVIPPASSARTALAGLGDRRWL
jgi:hypothetical protein